MWRALAFHNNSIIILYAIQDVCLLNSDYFGYWYTKCQNERFYWKLKDVYRCILDTS